MRARCDRAASRMSSLGDDLSDDDDDDVALAPVGGTGGASGKAASKPPVPKPTAVEAPAGIDPKLAALFNFSKPKTSTQTDVKAHIHKVLGKKRAGIIAATAKDQTKDDKAKKDGKGKNKGDGDESDSESLSYSGPLTKSIQKLVDDEAEDEKRRKKMRVANSEAKKLASDEKRAIEAIAQAMADKQLKAEQMKDDVREKAEAAAREIGNPDADDTPYPSAFVKALDDYAFGAVALDRFAPECPNPVPRTLQPFVDAAHNRVTLLKGSKEDEVTAVREALREAAEGGFLATAFAAAVDSNSLERTAHARTKRTNARAPPPCDANTARWLFQAAMRPESSHGVVLGARDALFASAGYEPVGIDCRAPPRQRRGVFPLPVVRESREGDDDNDGSDGIPEDGQVSNAPALAWVPTAQEIVEALRRLGVRAPDVGEDASDAPDTDAKGKGKAKSKKTVATQLKGERRKHVSVNALVGDMSLNKSISRQDYKDGAFALSGRSAQDRADAEALVRPPPGPLIPQVFAAVQLLAMWCERDGDGDQSSIVDDPNAAASLLAALGALRLDPRAAAVAHVVDAAASALLAAASRAAENGRESPATRDTRWRLFESAAAHALARVGPTHASRLSAVRWTPWNSPRKQRIQDLASTVALEDIQDILDILGKRVREKQTEPDSRKDDLRLAATAALSGMASVNVDGMTSPEEAWALVTAIHHVDVVLHAGIAEKEKESQDSESQSAGSAQKSFMGFLKNCKAKVPRSNKAGLAALKNLAVATYTRHQRAQQLRERRTD